MMEDPYAPQGVTPVTWSISGEDVEALGVARKNMKSPGTGES